MSAAARPDPDLYAPPDDATVNRAIDDYARAIREAYGPRVKGIHLFGSRARGDHTPESDADIAVVLYDAGWDFWTEKMRLADLAYKTIVETDAHVQGWPVAASDWTRPQPLENAALIREMRRDARPIGSTSE